MQVIIKTHDARETMQLGNKVGKLLRGGECIEFVSDVGGGKTTCIQGLVAGMGSIENVSSPTFTIGKQYSANGRTVYHYDFYRISDPGLLAEELAEALHDKNGVVLVEWGESVQDVLPETKVRLQIQRIKEGEHMRQITISFPEDLDYLKEIA